MAELPKRAQQVAVASVIGAVAGLALTGHRGWRRALAGALAGAAGLGAVEAAARALQRPDEIPALWARIAMSGALAAPAGWTAGVAGAGAAPVGTVAGAAAGALGLRPQKVALGPVVGAAAGLALPPGAPAPPGTPGARGAPGAPGAPAPPACRPAQPRPARRRRRWPGSGWYRRCCSAIRR